MSDRDPHVEIGSSPVPLATFPSAADGSGLRAHAVGAEFFPTRALGVPVGYSRPDGAFDLDTYDVRTTWFFKPRVAIQLGFSVGISSGSRAGA